MSLKSRLAKGLCFSLAIGAAGIFWQPRNCNIRVLQSGGGEIVFQRITGSTVTRDSDGLITGGEVMTKQSPAESGTASLAASVQHNDLPLMRVDHTDKVHACNWGDPG